MRKQRVNVGLIGLGIIGKRVAAALRAEGFQVFVWSRSIHVEPNFLGSPAEVAEVCDIIQIFVSDAAALFETLEAMRPVLGPRHLILCNATVGPVATVAAAEMVASTGARLLDAPFTGSKGAAEKRELVYYMSGDEESMRTAEPVLRASAKAVIRMGKIGEAATVKLATNMLVAVTVQALAEALAVVRQAGIDPALLQEALELHGVRSPILDMKIPKMLEDDYQPQFSLKHALKDLCLALQLAGKLDLPTTTLAADALAKAADRDWGDLDFSVVSKLYENVTPLLAPGATARKSLPFKKP